MTENPGLDGPRLDTTPRTAANKVPEVTASFWIVTVLATTVGKAAADHLDETLGLGLVVTSIVRTVLLAVVLVAQFRSRGHRPPVYWLAVVLISVVGTLLTDNLTNGLGVPLLTSTAVFAVLLTATFLLWRRVEGTLSIHAVDSSRRETFSWFAVLLTFALGTAAGDLVAEASGLGHGSSVVLFAVAIAVVAVLRYGLRLNAVGTFWAAYVLTRPLGASLGDLLSQDPADGGLGLGTTATSVLFLAAILAVVVHLSVSRIDAPDRSDVRPASSSSWTRCSWFRWKRCRTGQTVQGDLSRSRRARTPSPSGDDP